MLPKVTEGDFLKSPLDGRLHFSFSVWYASINISHFGGYELQIKFSIYGHLRKTHSNKCAYLEGLKFTRSTFL